MIRAVFLDSHPLSLASQRRGKPTADACKRWVAMLSRAGIRVYVPEITDYEVRRELIRAGKTAGISRLDVMKTTAHYLPVTTEAMLKAAELWAQARNAGVATADPKALDIDVILAAQALTAGYPSAEVIVATGNVAHLSHFVAADLWENITP